jgi:4-hydroxybenzoate polyprenyltransferase
MNSQLEGAKPPLNVSRTVKLLFIQLRPKQWTKNLLIFAALLFSYEIISFQLFSQSVIGFVIFSLVASSIYIWNDFIDREADREHPTKQFRPMASGALSPFIALSFGAFLLVASLIASYFVNPLYTLLLLVYTILNAAYSLKLKHVVIIDIMIIASGFVIRAIAGGLVIHVPLTPWFLMCTMLLSLFLAISKRRHEFLLAMESNGIHRKVLKSYSAQLLDQMNSIVTTATIISYSLFTFTSEHTIHLMWTIPLVIYGIFRHLYLIHVENKGGSPEQVLYEDKHILVTVILYVISVIFILGYFE